jgi:hypothetical protein
MNEKMTQTFDSKALKAFFQEVLDQIHIELTYHPENEKFPIQLANPDGLSRDKCNELLLFIKTQVDLRDTEICKMISSKKSGKVVMEITKVATHLLAEVYALSLFIEPDDEIEPD